MHAMYELGGGRSAESSIFITTSTETVPNKANLWRIDRPREARVRASEEPQPGAWPAGDA